MSRGASVASAKLIIIIWVAHTRGRMSCERDRGELSASQHAGGVLGDVNILWVGVVITSAHPSLQSRPPLCRSPWAH